MSKHRTQQEWIDILESAARSDLSVSEFCRQNSIPKNLFYWNSLKHGYTCDGKRTQKWIDAFSDASSQPVPTDYPAFVPVPAQTVQMALRPADVTSGQTECAILYDSFTIIVRDSISSDALRRILEAVRNA